MSFSAKAGIWFLENAGLAAWNWIPAFAGMTPWIRFAV
jgi:hypothetical protein